MKDFFVPSDLVLCGSVMEMQDNFSARGYSGGLSEDACSYVLLPGSAPLFIEFVGSSTGQGTSSDFSVDLPEGVVGGDFVLVAVTMASTADDYSVGVTTSGYTQVAELFSNDDRGTNFYIGYKFMAATPDSSVTIKGAPVAGKGVVAAVYVMRNVDAATPLDVTPTAATGNNSTTIDPPSITPVSPGAVIIAAGGAVSATYATMSSLPFGYSNPVTLGYDPGTSALVAVGMKEWVSGAENPGTFGVSYTSTLESWAAVTLALRPAT